MFFHSRSKRNVKRVSASLESFHFTRAKKTWPRRAACRNVSSSRAHRAAAHSCTLVFIRTSRTGTLGQIVSVCVCVCACAHHCLFAESGYKLVCTERRCVFLSSSSERMSGALSCHGVQGRPAGMPRPWCSSAGDRHFSATASGSEPAFWGLGVAVPAPSCHIFSP